ncbi:MAG: hypothetical protein F4X82_03075, partial [Candidatus Spechtbacteria bacterium SB0662_bin_43]|nr:hypothetical protein [Candidatus Spechtbacteria bacterium SB0662_bin_43]
MSHDTIRTDISVEGGKRSNIKLDQDFIKSLLKKLKTGNRRDIYLNAIPGSRKSRLDLKKLDSIKNGKSIEFLKTLFSKETFQYVIDFNEVNSVGLNDDQIKIQEDNLLFISRKLDNISIDNEEWFLESGIKNFGFGYPMIVRRDDADPKKVIVAPLLIWRLDIEKSNRKHSRWIITRTGNHSVRVNESLISHIENDSKVSIDSLSEDVLDDGIIDNQEIKDICDKVLSQINRNNKKQDISIFSIKECRKKEDIERLQGDEASVQQIGVFGIYTTRKESIIKCTDDILKQLLEFQTKIDDFVFERFQTFKTSAIPTDPSQEEIINTLNNNEIKLIQGPPGSGKSQALTAIITNVLSNGGKCLVVCEKKTALNVIYENLKKIGLSQLSIMIDDASNDRRHVVKDARERVDSVNSLYWGNNESRNSSRFKKLHDDFEKMRDNFNRKHFQERDEKDGDTRKNLIGQFLRHSKNLDWRTLESSIEVSLGDVFLNNKTYIRDAEDKITQAHKYFGGVKKESIDIFELLKVDYSQDYSREVEEKIRDIKEGLLKCKQYIDDLFIFVSALKDGDKYYFKVKDDSIFAIDNLKNKLSETDNKIDFLSDCQYNMKELLTAIDIQNTNIQSFTNSIQDYWIDNQVDSKKIDALPLLVLDSCIENMMNIAKCNIDACKLILQGNILVSDQLKEMYIKSQHEDIFQVSYSVDSVGELLKREEERIDILNSLHSEMKDINSLSGDNFNNDV